MKKNLIGLTVGLMVFGLTSTSQATSVTTHLTVDDAFRLYVSTDDTQLGNLVGENFDWENTRTFSFLLTPSTTNYIHIVGWDVGKVIAGFLGDFTLSDTGFEFSNDTQKLLTNTTDWKVYTDGFGGSAATLTDQGANGVGPWYSRPSIDPQAKWIWTGAGYDLETRYFSASITPNPTPEPATMLLMGTGLAGLIGTRRKKNA